MNRPSTENKWSYPGDRFIMHQATRKWNCVSLFSHSVVMYLISCYRGWFDLLRIMCKLSIGAECSKLSSKQRSEWFCTPMHASYVCECVWYGYHWICYAEKTIFLLRMEIIRGYLSYSKNIINLSPVARYTSQIRREWDTILNLLFPSDTNIVT